jgi:5-methylcytosine-specific restriction enzyme A
LSQAEIDLESLRPTAKARVYDLVHQAGIDVTDWSNYKKPEVPAANPKYCYEWAFTQEQDQLVILNLWFKDIRAEGNRVFCRFNIRALANEIERAADDRWANRTTKPVWAKRARKMDSAIQLAVRKKWPIRVVVCEGEIGNLKTNEDESKVQFRKLDDEPWTVTSYNIEDGETEITRGIAEEVATVVDQFDAVKLIEKPVHSKTVQGKIFSRDPGVRKAVLDRSQGHCEYCGEKGFVTISGQIYLETHHIVPLSEDGVDSTSNVIALCANDHKKAHFSEEKEKMGNEMKLKVASMMGSFRH